MRIVFLLMLILLLPMPLLAQVKTNYYPYIEKPIQLSNHSLNRYIMPQLKAISQEYFHLLTKLNPIHSESISLYNKILSLSRAMNPINKVCQESQHECQSTFTRSYKLARSIDRDISKLQSKYLRLDEPNQLLFIASLDKFSLQNYALLHKLEEHLITLKTNFSSYYFGKSQFQPIIHRLLLDSEFMLTQMLEGKLKDDFYAVWVGFFKKINQKLIYKRDKAYILRRLEDLNLSWNTFHMKMTKGNHNLPKNLIKIIKIMHNRWNSCLKVILM